MLRARRVQTRSLDADLILPLEQVANLSFLIYTRGGRVPLHPSCGHSENHMGTQNGL